MANGKDHLKDEGAGKEQVKPLVNKQIFYDLWEQDMPELAAEREKLEKMTEERLGEDEAGYLSLQVDDDLLAQSRKVDELIVEQMKRMGMLDENGKLAESQKPKKE